MSFFEVGNFERNGADNVDPRLIHILNRAAARSGMRVEAFSGYRPGDSRFHGKGMATDIRLIDNSTGKVMPNYQDPKYFSAYESFAKTARDEQTKLYPDLNDKFRWGGYFAGGKGKYGAMDLMHFDLGGSSKLGMAGGSWDGGLNSEQAKMWGINSSGAMYPELSSNQMASASPNNDVVQPASYQKPKPQGLIGKIENLISGNSNTTNTPTDVNNPQKSEGLLGKVGDFISRAGYSVDNSPEEPGSLTSYQKLMKNNAIGQGGYEMNNILKQIGLDPATKSPMVPTPDSVVGASAPVPPVSSSPLSGITPPRAYPDVMQQPNAAQAAPDILQQVKPPTSGAKVSEAAPSTKVADRGGVMALLQKMANNNKNATQAAATAATQGAGVGGIKSGGFGNGILSRLLGSLFS